MKLFSLVLAGILSFATALPAVAGAPTEEIKSTADHVLALLKNPDLQGVEKKSQRVRVVQKEMEGRFAWNDCARACLGKYWSKRTPAEQKEFITLFSSFLKATYADKIATYYDNLAKIDYQGEKVVDGFASVKTLIKSKANYEHPVEYRLEKSGDGASWKVYDVVIEGVSLIKNYRDQFDGIIARSSYEGLIKELKTRPEAHQ